MKLGLLMHLTIDYRNLFAKGNTRLSKQDHLAIFIAGDDFKEKAVIAGSLKNWFTPVDTGSLREGDCKQQPGLSVFTNRSTIAK